MKPLHQAIVDHLYATGRAASLSTICAVLNEPSGKVQPALRTLRKEGLVVLTGHGKYRLENSVKTRMGKEAKQAELPPEPPATKPRSGPFTKRSRDGLPNPETPGEPPRGGLVDLTGDPGPMAQQLQAEPVTPVELPSPAAFDTAKLSGTPEPSDEELLAVEAEEKENGSENWTNRTGGHGRGQARRETPWADSADGGGVCDGVSYEQASTDPLGFGAGSADEPSPLAAQREDPQPAEERTKEPREEPVAVETFRPKCRHCKRFSALHPRVSAPESWIGSCTLHGVVDGSEQNSCHTDLNPEPVEEHQAPTPDAELDNLEASAAALRRRIADQLQRATDELDRRRDEYRASVRPLKERISRLCEMLG